MTASLLIEDLKVTSFKLEEANDGSGRVIARGQFARSDKATENKRLYREHLWKREIGRLDEAMKGRRALGELDHPADGRTKLQRVSHILTSLRVEGNEVVGEAEILDTPNGRILKSLFKQGVAVGVSSRGYGSTKSLADGTEEVQEDFRLDTFDFVADPATRTAYPKVFSEEREHIAQAEKDGLTLENIRTEYPGLVRIIAEESLSTVNRSIVEAEERAVNRAKTTFATQLRRMVETVDDEAYRRARSELESDPEVAGAKTIIEQIATLIAPFGLDMRAKEIIDAKDAAIEKLRGDLGQRELEAQAAVREAQEAKKLAKDAAYLLHAERAVSEHAQHATIIKLLGPISGYDSTKAIDERIAEITKDLPGNGRSKNEESVREHEEEISALRKENTDLKAKLRTAETDRADEAAKTQAAVTESNKLRVRLHVEGRVATLDNAARIRRLTESADSTEEADQIIREFVAAPRRLPDNDEAERIRSRVGRGKQRDLQEDTNGKPSTPPKGKDSGGNSLLEEVGLSSSDFDRLAP